MKSRTQYSMLNSSISSIVYLVRMLLGFVSRSFFIQCLGIQYLGLNGLFSNVLSFLSLAELGIGTSIVFEMYRPVATRDRETIKSLMQFYRRAYTVIGVCIAILGIMLVPFLHLFLNDASRIPFVYMYYILFLTNSVVSYFFTYKRSMLNADQKNYLVILNDFIFFVVMTVLQILVLVFMKSYTLFLIFQIVTTLVSNLAISLIVNRKYPFLKDKNVKTLSPEITRHMRKNVVGNISSQIGSIVVLGSDNILISSFVGIAAVGIYSNYTLITNAIRSLMQQATSAVISSVGNLVVKANNSMTLSVFKSYLFINTFISFFAATGIAMFINNFIRIWVGRQFLLSNLTVFLISLYVMLLMYQGSVRTFISAYGLFWQQRWKPLFEAGVNLFFSLLFLVVFRLGIDGVLLGTIVSSLLVNIWFEPYLVFHFGIHDGSAAYALFTIKTFLKFLAVSFFVFWIQHFFVVRDIWDFVFFGCIMLPVLLIIMAICFGTSPEVKKLWLRFSRK
ncbi:lipopolysaccharide biosynthesis protein [Oenococcus oeni]|uniref:lipopolysaccharide biosynthesis protein n=1 Tax=Oenococcus oeni TaxID=1247 RepID=UPI0010BA250A|nr:oligosaccharide flippase family protein [Oenococcus oeni]SYW09689.1 Transporter [Oenococcus oeni]